MKTEDDVIQSIEDVTSLFYQNKHKLGYAELEKLIILIEDSLLELYKASKLAIDVSNILDILKEATVAMEQKDTMLLADILEYELKDAFKNIKSR